jgi:predicted deacetylase
MYRLKWRAIEELLDDFGIKPIVAVVPDNRDPGLTVDSTDPNFWAKVRGWQAKGWSIAMHGYQHLMHHTKSKLVLPYYERSEFAGLPYEHQAEKIRNSWEIFLSQDVAPTIWVAPAHCFDRITLKAIRDETTIRIVSDGIARDQYFDDGFFWIPQQLWKLTEKSDGLWTVCLHPNTLTEGQISTLRQSLEERFLERVISVAELELRERFKSIRDNLEEVLFWQRHRMNKVISQAKAILCG